MSFQAREFRKLQNIVESQSLTHFLENGETMYNARQSYIESERNFLAELTEQLNSAGVSFKVVSHEKWESVYPLKTGQTVWTTTVTFTVSW